MVTYLRLLFVCYFKLYLACCYVAKICRSSCWAPFLWGPCSAEHANMPKSASGWTVTLRLFPLHRRVDFFFERSGSCTTETREKQRGRTQYDKHLHGQATKNYRKKLRAIGIVVYHSSAFLTQAVVTYTGRDLRM